MTRDDDGLPADIATNLNAKGWGCRGVLSEIRWGDHSISPGDRWWQAPGLKIAVYALCKTHLLIIDGKTESVFMEVEPTVNTLVHFRGITCRKRLVQSSCWPQWNGFPVPHFCKLQNLTTSTCVWFHLGSLFLLYRLHLQEKDTAKARLTARTSLCNLYGHNGCLEWVWMGNEWCQL